MKKVLESLKSLNEIIDVFGDDFEMPSSWPDSFKEIFRITVSDGEVSDKERAYLRRRGQEAGIDGDEIDIVIDRAIKRAKEFDLDDNISDDDIYEELPPELARYRGIIEAMENGDVTGAIAAGVKCFLPLILVCLAIIVIAFIVKWWLGIIALFGVAAYLCVKAYGIYKQLEDL